MCNFTKCCPKGPVRAPRVLLPASLQGSGTLAPGTHSPAHSSAFCQGTLGLGWAGQSPSHWGRSTGCLQLPALDLGLAFGVCGQP